jgi:hypothetical protein
MFNEGAAALPTGLDFADTVVFLVARSTEAALLLQEWDIQRPSLPAGSEHVFWLGTDSVRSSVVTNLVSLNTLRNLYVIDPYTLGPESDFFTELYQKRWGLDPDQYAGNAFDAVLLAALANDRAGRIQMAAGGGNLGPNNASAIKDSLQPVSTGCLTQEKPSSNPFTLCPVQPTSFESSNLAAAMAALRGGSEIVFFGATGNLKMSPAGDVLKRSRLWKIATEGEQLGFFVTKDDIDPQSFGIGLEQ